MLNKRLFVYNDSRIVGGHELLTVQIMNLLAERHGVVVHFAYHCDELTPHLSARIATSHLPFHNKSANLYQLLRRDISLVKKTVAGFKPDLAVISQGFIESGVRGLVACRLAGVRTGSYIPFGNSNRELGNRFALLRDVVSVPIFGLNQFYITISAYQSRSLERLLSGQRRYVINNPVAQQPTAPKPPVVLSPDPDRVLNIAVVGRILFKQKNQDILVPVAQRLAAQGFRVHFHIVGDGPDRAGLEALVATGGCADHFTFHNWLGKAQLAAFLEHNIDALLVPSHYEGLPLVFLEAVYLGKPVLISTMPFLCDYPVPDCYLVDPASAQSIAARIQHLAAQDNRAHMLVLQEFVRQTNSYERFVRDIEDCFQSLFECAAASG